MVTIRPDADGETPSKAPHDRWAMSCVSASSLICTYALVRRIKKLCSKQHSFIS
jgi:hypothetical protein